MNQNGQNRRRNENEEEDTNGWGFWAGLGAAAVVSAAAATGIYYATRTSGSAQQERGDDRPDQRERRPSPPESIASTATSYLNCLMERATLNESEEIRFESSRGRLKTHPPENPLINNLHSLLSDIYVRHVALRQDDFELHYTVFHSIFYHLHQKMKDVDSYYERYSSTVQFAGSHYDRLRIKKPDEFDMDVVIGLPLSIKNHPLNVAESDFIIEPKEAGFVHLKMGVQYDKLPMRDGGSSWEINKTAYKWKDDSNYLLRSKFIDWFKGVVVRALNKFEHRHYLPVFKVDNNEYTIDKSESGPAVTLIIRNRVNNFRMDVDLVPALKFPEDRWLGSSTPDYRQIPLFCKKGYWMVVPKPNKSGCHVSKSRSWRIALHYQERELLHNTNNLRPAIRLLKKLRDAQDMGKIASYYIKTLAFWEIIAINDLSYWEQSPAVLFKLMVQRFYEAMVAGSIPYFWNENNNLLEGINQQVLNGYAVKLKKLLDVLEVPSDYKKVAKFLLTREEIEEYNRKFLHI